MSHPTADDSWRERVLRPLRRLPTDLVAVVVFVAVVDLAVLLPTVRGTPLAVALGVPLLLFVPGYVVVAALFPASGPEPVPSELSGLANAAHRVRTNGIDGVERAALSFGISLALLPLVGLLLAALPWGIDPVPVLAAVSAIGLLGAVLAGVRRRRLPETDRFDLRVESRIRELHAAIFEADGRLDAVLNLALALAVLIALTSVGYAVAASRDAPSSSQLYLLAENETGDLVTAGYPTEFARGESRPVYVGVENHEGEPVNYTVVAELQRVRQAENGLTVVDQQRVATFEPRVSAGESWQARHGVAPSMTGRNLRLVYFLYRTDPPSDPTTESADEFVHVWINVSSEAADS